MKVNLQRDNKQRGFGAGDINDIKTLYHEKVLFHNHHYNDGTDSHVDNGLHRRERRRGV